jgi:hypothetical protein
MNRQRPRLKNGVDLQLQSAFHDGNWPVVIRLAEKRAKLSNDQYYEVSFTTHRFMFQRQFGKLMKLTEHFVTAVSQNMRREPA